jgi:hypothetical protein
MTVQSDWFLNCCTLTFAPQTNASTVPVLCGPHTHLREDEREKNGRYVLIRKTGLYHYASETFA